MGDLSAELDGIFDTFLAESRELLSEMEARLMELEANPEEPETLDALFRTVHTIKGSSGICGLDPVVAFSHTVESVLDRMRARELSASAPLIAVLLRCADHLETLIGEVSRGATGAATLESGAAILRELEACVAAPARADAPGAAPSSAEREGPHWHLSLGFGRGVFQQGMDPLSFLRYLGTLGRRVHVETLCGSPVSGEPDPESCYLRFEVAFASDARREEIELVFEFVRDDCELGLIEPGAAPSRFAELLRGEPKERALVGERLVRCGSLSPAALEALLADAALAARQAPSRPPIELTPDPGVEPPVSPAARGPSPSPSRADSRPAAEERASASRFVRIQADKLDRLIDAVGELVTAADATQLHARRLNDEALHETASLLARLVGEVRDGSLSLRMAQIGDTFGRFRRVVHDVAKELGKDIALEMRGQETELDKSVIDRLADPLVHLVRNAIDHGIEAGEVRRARGKPERGRVELGAWHDGGTIVVEVADDGGGLDRAKILAKARAKGLVGPADEPSDEEVYRLIFEPGFSTAAAVTSLSGRGVGMDVVRRNVEALRGSIEIENAPGRGAAIRLRVPLSLAIIDAFLVGVAETSYVIPLESVVECVHFTPQRRRQAGDARYANLRGEVLPFVRLRELFRLPPAPKGQAEHIVVVQVGAKRAGIVVESLLGEHQAVIRPLAPLFGTVPGLSGTTILGSGEVALILDVPGLLQRAASGDSPGIRRVA